MSRFEKLLKRSPQPQSKQPQPKNIFKQKPKQPTEDERIARDRVAKEAGLLILVSGEVYERQLDHQKRTKEERDYHLFLEWIDDRYVCYWRSYSNGMLAKEKMIAHGDWERVFGRAKKTIKWWDSRRK